MYPPYDKAQVEAEQQQAVEKLVQNMTISEQPPSPIVEKTEPEKVDDEST
jgi:hypothetical protein